MITATDVITKHELHGMTVRTRCARLFTRNEFDRLLSLTMTEVFVAGVALKHRKNLAIGAFDIGDRVVFAQKILRECHNSWCAKESNLEQDGILFFRSLTHSTAEDFRVCMAWDVKEYWASLGMLENGGFMVYLEPFIEIVRGLLDDNTGTGGPAALH